MPLVIEIWLIVCTPRPVSCTLTSICLGLVASTPTMAQAGGVVSTSVALNS